MRRAVWITLAAVAFAGGCDRKKRADRASDGGAGAAAPVADAAAYQASGKKPANARRAAAPPEIAKALGVGAKTPDVQLASVSGPTRGTFHLSDVLAKERALIVFYRGDW
ncbi:MAG: hypothetical protein K8M05_19415 [Deltaproteobacteria bacterium]|nr:hypothetical protein [Kofleriaceae bacterium]